MQCNNRKRKWASGENLRKEDRSDEIRPKRKMTNKDLILVDWLRINRNCMDFFSVEYLIDVITVGLAEMQICDHSSDMETEKFGDERQNVPSSSPMNVSSEQVPVVVARTDNKRKLESVNSTISKDYCDYSAAPKIQKTDDCSVQYKNLHYTSLNGHVLSEKSAEMKRQTEHDKTSPVNLDRRCLKQISRSKSLLGLKSKQSSEATLLMLQNQINKIIDKDSFANPLINDLALSFIENGFVNCTKDFRLTAHMNSMLSDLLKINDMRKRHKTRFAAVVVSIFRRIVRFVRIESHNTKLTSVRFLNVFKDYLKNANKTLWKCWYQSEQALNWWSLFICSFYNV